MVTILLCESLFFLSHLQFALLPEQLSAMLHCMLLLQYLTLDEQAGSCPPLHLAGISEAHTCTNT